LKLSWLILKLSQQMRKQNSSLEMQIWKVPQQVHLELLLHLEIKEQDNNPQVKPKEQDNSQQDNNPQVKLKEQDNSQQDNNPQVKLKVQVNNQ
jgi:hypothetical protein